MFKLVLLSLVGFVSFLHLVSTNSFGQPERPQAPEIPIYFEDRLREIGNKFDRYFTIEAGNISGNRAQSIEGHIFSTRLKQTSLHRVLEHLRRTIPNLIYRINEQNPKIIHIIDARLLRQKDYAMEKMLDEFSFDGGVYKFGNAIGRKGVNISSQGGGCP